MSQGKEAIKRGVRNVKKNYAKPYVTIEEYELSSNIASNCALVVNMGPEGPGAIEICQDYYDKTGETRPKNGIAAYSLPYNVQFWTDESCDCYYSAGEAGCFTS